MSVDEFVLRQEAKDLAGLYRELDAGKFAQQRQPEVRTMKPSPGPRSPAPDHLVSLDEELTSRLFEMVSEVRSHIRPTLILTKNGMRLCSFLAFNAQAVSELDVAPDLMDEMKDQARQIKRIVAPRGIDHVAKRAEPRHLGGIIISRLSNMGHKVTREQLRTWAVRSAKELEANPDAPVVTSHQRPDGRATYLMTEVLAYINRGKEDGEHEEP